MAKRKLNRQQQSRISKAQEKARVADVGIEGLVVAHHGGQILAELANGENIDVQIKSNLGNIVSGDRVVIEINKNGEYRAIAIRPRESFLQRQDGFGHLKAVAANISQLIICCAIKPEPNFLLLDQYLLSAEQLDINAVILLNKVDLLDPVDSDPFRLKEVYGPIGYQFISVSTKSNLGMDNLKCALQGHSSVICGVSGVGKSSIIQSILPEEPIKVGAISEFNEEGKHTTRTSRLYHLPDGGDLIDTPGVRGFTPHFDVKWPIYLGFPEIANEAQSCKFSNCRHLNEPGCNVNAAIQHKRISMSRYESYLKFSGLGE